MPYPARLLDTFQGRTTLSVPFSVCTGVPLNAVTPRLCLRRLVLTNSTSLAPPQAAGLVRSVARPLQIANAPLVCNLVPSVLPEKNGEKRGAWGRAILRAHARDFYLTPCRAQNCNFPYSCWFRCFLQVCRGRCGHRPLQTCAKNEQGGQRRPPLQMFTI